MNKPLEPHPTASARRAAANALPPILGALAAIIAPVSFAQAPAVPAPKAAPADEVVELSPFVINSRKDTGYQATSTLAGTRLRTNVGDLATSIQIVTKQFMEDTGSTSARDLLVYTTGTEVAGVRGNFSNTSRSNENITLELGNFRRGPANRVRGIAAADTTRDYFPTGIPFDAYNVQSVEINRGANAALFGLGSPAGIINNSLSRAEDRTFGSVALGGGDYGSYRLTGDYNQLSPDRQLAVRAASVYDHRGFQQDPAYSRDRRGYVAFKFEPELLRNKGAVSGVTVRGNYESGSVRSNLPRTLPISDAITRYFSLGKISWDPTVDNLAATNRDINSHNGTFTLVSMWPNPNSPVPTLGTIGIPNPSRPPSAATGQPIFAAYGSVTRQFQNLTRVGGDPFIPDPQITDTKVLDYRNYMIDGPNKSEFQDFRVGNVGLEARFLENTLGVEIAFNKERYKNGGFNPLRGGNANDSEVHIDNNTKLFTGEPNPNYGRPYLVAKGNANTTEEAREVKRATAYYNFDFAKVVSPALGRWLGKHTLTLTAGEQRLKAFNAEGFGYVPDASLLRYQGTLNYSDVNSSVATMFLYLGPSVLNLNRTADVRLSPVTVELRPDLQGGTGATATNRYVVFNPATNRYEIQQLGVIRQDPRNIQFVNNGSRTKDTVDSEAAVLQSNMLKETVVVTSSLRKDRARSYAPASPSRGAFGNLLTDETNLGVSGTPTVDVEDSSFAWGAVGKLTKMLPLRRDLGFGLNAFYNTSQNFQPQGTRQDAYGKSIAPPSGKTKDYGVSLSIPAANLDLRATWFETRQSGVSTDLSNVISLVAIQERNVNYHLANGVPASAIQSFSPGITQAEIDRQLALFRASPWPHTARYGINAAGTAFTVPVGTTDTATVQSKGLELEAVMNPTSNWRIMFNAAKQEAVQTNTGTSTLAFINERMSLYNSAPDVPTLPSFGSNIRADTRNILANYYRSVALDGTVRPEVRKWRFNAITNYKFTRFGLNGVGIGGAYRWEDRGGIGYQTFRDATLGIYRIDPTKPYYAPASDRVDGWISYQRKILSNKVAWKLQLNVRNLLDIDKLVPIYRTTDYASTQYRIPEGRRWDLTSQFEF